MDLRLDGRNPLSYLGVNPLSPVPFEEHPFAPTANDSRNRTIGSVWLWQDATIPADHQKVYMLVSLNQGVATWVQFLPSTGVAIDSLTGDSGGPVFATANNINIVGSGSITVVGNPGTSTLTITPSSAIATQYDTDSGNAIPSGGILNIVGDGVIITTSGAGNTVTITGSDTLATTFDTDSGTAVPSAGFINIIADTVSFHAGKSVSFSGAGNTVTLNVTDSQSNTMIGLSSGMSVTSGASNTSLGEASLEGVTTGARNVGIGLDSGADLTTGIRNVLIGAQSGSLITSGSRNIILGDTAGFHYLGAESDNIVLGYAVTGTVSENNVLRIGAATGTGQGNLQSAYICGIDGVNVGSVATVVTEASDQLGTATIVAGSGITITPGPNSITISATGGGGGGGALEFIQVQTVSSVTEVDFTSGITPTFDNYLLKIWNNTFDALPSAANLVVQFSVDGGATYITTGYVTVGAGTTAGCLLVPLSGEPVDSTVAGEYFLYSLTDGLAASYPSLTGLFNLTDVGAFGSNEAAVCGAYPVGSTVVDALRIVMDDGSTFSGSFALYCYATTGGGGGGGGATTFPTDSGTATEAGGVLSILGSGNVTTSGAGNVVTAGLTGITNHSLQVGGAANALTQLGVAANGQLPIGSVGANPVLATLTAGSGINITNAAGSITIAATGAGAATSFITNPATGTATPSAGVITFAGAGGTVVSASGSTVTITSSTTSLYIYTAVNHGASPYTVLSGDEYISCDVTAGVISILLPNSPATGRSYTIKDKVGLAATSNITVSTVGGVVNIDGATTLVMNTAYEAVNVIFNGTSYEVW